MGAVKEGNAAFQLTAPSGAVMTCPLNRPLEFESVPAHSTHRSERTSLDLSAFEVVTVGSGRAEVETVVRFERDAQRLLDVLSYAADGAVISYIPDLDIGDTYPLRLIGEGPTIQLGAEPGREAFYEYGKRLRFRDASASGQSLEALSSPWLFRMRGGVFPRLGTFTRTGDPSNAWYRDVDGIWKQAASGAPRHGFVEVGGVLVPAFMAEPAATNDLLDSADIDPDDANWDENAAWTQAAAVALFEGKTSQKFTNDGSTGGHWISQATPNLVGTSVVCSLIIERGTVTITSFGLSDDTVGDWVVRAQYNWGTGLASVTDFGVGSSPSVIAQQLAATGPNGGELVRVQITAIADNPGNVGGLYIYPTGTGVNGESAILHHAQHEDGAVATSPIVTDGSTKTRNAERPYAPFPHRPQALTVYWKGLVVDLPNGGDVWPRFVSIGGEDSGAGFGVFFDRTAANLVAKLNNGGASGSATVNASSISRFDEIEVRAVLRADASFFPAFSVGGGAESAGTPSAAVSSLPSDWASPHISIGAHFNGVSSWTNPSKHEHEDLIVFPGEKTLAECRTLAA